MTSRRLLLLSALIAFVPASASAGDRSWWAWLEELSGPGYFTGFMVTVDLKCTPPEGRCGNYKAPDLTIDRGDRINKTISVTFGRLSSGNRPRFKDLPSATGDPNLDTVYAYPLHTTVRWRLHRSMDLGPGAGVLLFSGNNVNDHVRIILIPVSASWKPALTKQSWRDSRWTRAFQHRLRGVLHHPRIQRGVIRELGYNLPLDSATAGTDRDLLRPRGNDLQG